ncbi:HEPN domain-containing protein [Mycolicibacterium porcinum]|uniref:HEPN domain-containing protein n=1 Tax=Mycolicibacterium porcinum TaxID=39693 RepID=A0ABV3VDI2_9MYCO
MTDSRFPSGAASCLGQFWRPGETTDRRTGVVRVAESRVELEVSPGLTPTWVSRQLADGRVATSRAPDPNDMVVLGSISARPSLVSLWDLSTRQRQSIGIPVPGTDQPESHKMVGHWCLVGAHLPDSKTTFLGVRLDIGNLTEWAWLPGIDFEYVLGSDRLTWSYDTTVDDDDARLPSNEGYMTLGPELSMTFPDIHGTKLTTFASLEAELVQGWTLSECFGRFVTPLSTLMTLLSGESCRARSLSVWTEQDGWIDIHGRGIEPESPAKCGELLLHREQAGLDFFSNWLSIHRQVSPVPQILAATVRKELPTIEAEALSLVTAMEALHRILDPAAKRFSNAEVDAAVRSLATSEVPATIRKSFIDALGLWWPEYSYPMRVKALAEPVSAAVPKCVGHLNRWKAAVVEQRVSLAHGLGTNGLTADLALQMVALNRSIRWMLLIRLLLLAKVPADVLRVATDQSEDFQRDHRLCREQWPRIFAN